MKKYPRGNGSGYRNGDGDGGFGYASGSGSYGYTSGDHGYGSGIYGIYGYGNYPIWQVTR